MEGGCIVRKRCRGVNDVIGAGDVEVVTVELLALVETLVGLVMKSFSLSREFKRRSQTRNLLGDATSAASFELQTAELPRQRRFAINRRPMRLFLGEGSISVSEKSEKSELVAAVSEPLSINIGMGEAAVARRR